jgi:hypothetical protein
MPRKFGGPHIGALTFPDELQAKLFGIVQDVDAPADQKARRDGKRKPRSEESQRSHGGFPWGAATAQRFHNVSRGTNF